LLAFGNRFYAILFDRNPELRPLFKNDIALQTRMLTSMLSSLVKCSNGLTRRVLAMLCADLRGIAPDRPLARTAEPGAHPSVLPQAYDTATDPTRSERLYYSPDVHRQKPGPRKCRETRDLLHGRVQ
jgi:hypothetical protein